MILGVGIDAVAIDRMRLALERSPRLAQRVFTQGELEYANGRGRPIASLAARFAAKEACRKALRASLPWRAVEVTSENGAPSLRVDGRSDVRFHVSLSHTDDLAVALVIAES
jgi:holo-[acyl-carrier protein] synthase